MAAALHPHPVLACEGLGKRYGARRALHNVHLKVGQGEIVALLGPNGAGKSTLLRCCATLARPSAGGLWIGGVDALGDGAAARARIGFAGDVPRLYGALTVEENLRFVAPFFSSERRVPGLLAALDLKDRGLERAGSLSRGMAQRLAIARALVGNPALLLLDEAFAALDPIGRNKVAAVLATAAARGAAVMFSAPHLDHAPPGLTRVVALRDGTIAMDAEGSLAQLRAAWQSHQARAVSQ